MFPWAELCVFRNRGFFKASYFVPFTFKAPCIGRSQHHVLQTVLGDARYLVWVFSSCVKAARSGCNSQPCKAHFRPHAACTRHRWRECRADAPGVHRVSVHACMWELNKLNNACWNNSIVLYCVRCSKLELEPDRIWTTKRHAKARTKKSWEYVS